MPLKLHLMQGWADGNIETIDNNGMYGIHHTNANFYCGFYLWYFCSAGTILLSLFDVSVLVKTTLSSLYYCLYQGGKRKMEIHFVTLAMCHDPAYLQHTPPGSTLQLFAVLCIMLYSYQSSFFFIVIVATWLILYSLNVCFIS